MTMCTMSLSTQDSTELSRQDGDSSGVDRILFFRSRQGEANFNHQSALRPIRYSDRTPVETHRTIRDCQAQADTAGLAPAGIVDAVERAKQFVQGILGHAGAGVGYPHDGFSFERTPVVQACGRIR